ncbi:MAG TPA: hypothetical protein VNH18_12190 [Bryobacteraceae bacterium]|nr:hypothetical protein [Bryobacteraceae bacterium]
MAPPARSPEKLLLQNVSQERGTHTVDARRGEAIAAEAALLHAPIAEQILLQPDSPDRLTPPPGVMVPEAMVWTHKKRLGALIVPGIASVVQARESQFAVDLPIPEFRVRDLAASAVPLPPLAAPAATVSRASNDVSTGQLISVSDIPLPPDVRIAVPPANQFARVRETGNGQQRRSTHPTAVEALLIIPHSQD